MAPRRKRAVGSDRLLGELLSYWKQRGDTELVPLAVGMLSMATWFGKPRQTESVSADVYVMY